MKDIVTVKQAAELIPCDPRTIHRAIHNGCIYQGIDRQLRFSIAGNRQFLITLQHVLVQNCQLRYTKINKCHASKATYQLEYGGNRQVPRILAYLYEGATTYLDRKAKFYFRQLSK